MYKLRGSGVREAARRGGRGGGPDARSACKMTDDDESLHADRRDALAPSSRSGWTVPSPYSLPSLEAVLGSVPYSAVALVDRDGTYRLVAGKLWAELDVDPRSDLMGRTIRELWDEETATALFANIDASLGGEMSEGLVPWGGRVYRVVTSPVEPTLGTGDPMVLLFARDVTEQEESEQLFRDVVKAVPVGVQATDAEGRVIVWNEGAEVVFGVAAAQAVGMDAEALARQLDFERPASLERAIEERRPWAGDLSLRRPDGADRRVELLRRPTGAGRRSVSIARDVTELRRRRVVEERERRLRSLGRVAGGVAHDFGNLLTAITGRVDLIAEELEGTELEAEIEEIREALDTAAQLTARLLTVGDTRSDRGHCDPSEVVGRMEMLLKRLTPSNVAIELRLAEPTWVGLGATDVEQIVLNLVSNAADAMPAGGTVRLELEPGDELVVLRVRDSGSGIDAEVLPHIFDPFVSTKPVGGGSGIGLATVHGLAHAAGGHVGVEATGPSGTTVRVDLPRVDPAEEGDGTEKGEPDEGAARPAVGTRVLVVEDEPQVSSLVELSLRRDGYEPVVHASVAPALEELERNADGIRLVLSDVSLPGVDGITFAAEVRARWAHIPMILMSGNFALQIERHGSVPPGVTTLDKPFGLDRLREAVAAALEGA